MPAIGKISGQIFDNKTKDAIEFANIIIHSKRDSSIVGGGITNKQGLFVIDKLKFGRYYVEINLIGYGNKIIENVSISPKNQEVHIGKVYLSVDAEILAEAEVSATVNQIDYKLDRKVINVSQDLAASGETAVEVLENAPSIETDIDGNVSVRGSESFLVLIDGRPSPLEGSEALQQIPANTIESIEIITNPSAKYDPDGVGGIINVKLIKEKRQGYNGQVSLNYGRFNTVGGSALFNFRTDKLNFFVGGDYKSRQMQANSESSRETFLNGDTTFLLNNYTDRIMGRNSGNVRAGIDYYITDNDIITISGRYGTSNRINSSDIWAESFYNNTINDFNQYYYLSEGNTDGNRNYLVGDINYTKKFTKPGHELMVYASYSADSNNEIDKFTELETDVFRNPISNLIDNYRTSNTSSGNTTKGNIDYTLPIGKDSKFEAGYQLSSSNLDNDYRYQILNGENWEDDPSQINPYTFSQNIQSGYAIFSDYIAGFGYQIGIRTEYTDRIFHQIESNEKWAYNKFDFFPSVHLSYQLPSETQFMASYSRRLSRPRNHHLDPFIEVVDPNNVDIGNPLLAPEYTNSFDLGVQQKFGTHFIAIEAYARHTTDKMSRVTMVDPNNNDIFITTHDNIGEDLSIGTELMTSLNLTSWYNLNISGSAFYYEIISDKYQSNNTVTWRTRINNSFKIKKTGTSIQFSGNYSGPSISAQGTRSAFLRFDAGIKQDFLDRKLSLAVSVRDVLGTMKYENIMVTPEFNYTSVWNPNTPSFNITLTYKINDFKRQANKWDSQEYDEDEGGM